MAIKALEGLVPEWYTPPGQPEGEPETRFRLRPLNGREFGEVADYITLESGRVMIRAQGIDQCLKLALVDWENFSDSNGPVRFSLANMDLIPYAQRNHLATIVVNRSVLEEGDVKN